MKNWRGTGKELERNWKGTGEELERPWKERVLPQSRCLKELRETMKVFNESVFNTRDSIRLPPVYKDTDHIQ